MNLNFLVIGNITTLLGTSLLVRTILRDRKVLRGYDVWGSLLTFLALSFFLIAFYQLNDFISVVTAIPTWFYWLCVSIFTRRIKR